LGGPVSSQTKKAAITDEEAAQGMLFTMPWGLRRFQETGQRHFPTFSCYKRRPNFTNAPSQTTFETSLEQVRRRYGLCVYGYVVMSEHIHMLVNEPEQGLLSRVMQSLKQSVARTLALRSGRLDTTISTYGASTSLLRSSAIFTGIR
jgi:putative transposase